MNYLLRRAGALSACFFLVWGCGRPGKTPRLTRDGKKKSA
jgi:hypothetical protein